MALRAQSIISSLGRRTSLPPKELRELTDALVENPWTAWRLIGVGPNTPAGPNVTPEEIYRWLDILDDARDLELSTAPSNRQYIETGASGGIAAVGLGLAFAGPLFDSVIIQRDTHCDERLRAIMRALDILRYAV